MKKFSVEALARMIGAETDGAVQASFDGVSTDSRTVKPSDCFFAIAGEKFDGHDFVAEVFSKGAACAVVSRQLGNARLAGRPILRVDDTVKALGDFARHYRQQCSFKVIAITGSVGKTTTRQMIHHVLSQRYRAAQSPKSFNNSIGLPMTLLAAEPDDDVVVAEIGANHPGEISYLTRIAQPDIAVITNVHPAHLEGFGDIDTIVREKLSITEGLGTNGLLIINADIEQLVGACAAGGLVFRSFGMSPRADYRAEGITCLGLNSSFIISGTEIHLPLPGPGNVENALAACAVCSQFRLSIDEFADAVRTIKSVSMRAELLQVGTVTILNDCYNANPASMRNALEILAGLASERNPQGERRLVFVCGEMAELGRESERLHAELGTQAASLGVELLLAVGKSAWITAEAASNAAGGNLETARFADTVSLCNSLEKYIKGRDIILVKGSRAAKLETAVEKLKELFAPAPTTYAIEEVARPSTTRRAVEAETKETRRGLLRRSP